MTELGGRTALVTGGGTGIGEAIACAASTFVALTFVAALEFAGHVFKSKPL